MNAGWRLLEVRGSPNLQNALEDDQRRFDSNQPLEKEALPFIEGLAARPIDGLELLVV